MSEPKFGDVVDTTTLPSPEQQEVRKRGFSPISYEGTPVTYHAGDVVYLPYENNETSTIEAIGLAWAAFASGVGPTD
jgi:hypothetical protein